MKLCLTITLIWLFTLPALSSHKCVTVDQGIEIIKNLSPSVYIIAELTGTDAEKARGIYNKTPPVVSHIDRLDFIIILYRRGSAFVLVLLISDKCIKGAIQVLVLTAKRLWPKVNYEAIPVLDET